MTTETKILSKSARPAFKVDGSRSTSFFRPFIQPKLTINLPNDIYEQEANAVAEKVMRMPDPKTEPLFFQQQPLPVTPLQRKCAACEDEEKLHRKEDDEEEPVQLKAIKEFDVQRKCSHCEEEETVQMKGENVASGGMAAPSIVHSVINSGGQPLDRSTRNFMESRFGYDFGNVQIHNDPAAHQSSKEINALAYTYGDHVVFGSGQYQPSTNFGKQLLAHELTHVVQQANVNSRFRATELVLSPQGSKPPNFIQRRERGSGLDDPLYMADRKWSSGQGPDDRVTGRRLQNWAIARASIEINSENSLSRMQVQDGVESVIVDEIYALLIDLLLGHNPTDPSATSHFIVTNGKYERPSFDKTRLDEFEGSDNARQSAVLELADHWGPIEHFLIGRLLTIYRDSYFEALGRTPKDMTLEEETEEIRRIRTNPFRHEHIITQGMAGDIILRVGQRFGRLHIKDINKFLGSRSTGPGIVWSYLDGHPLWYYSGSVDLYDRQTVIGEVARGIAENAKFAGQLFPLMIKAAGLALSFSPAPFIMIAGVVVEELGEEGMRDLSGEGRSFRDIAGSAGREILVNLILGKLMGGRGEGKGATEAAEVLDKVAEKAAFRIRDSVEKEIIRTEAPEVARAVEAGDLRIVTDKPLFDEGFTYEVGVIHSGGRHTYRMKDNGNWCRWSRRRLCNLDFNDAERIIKEKAEKLQSEEAELLEQYGVHENKPVDIRLAEAKKGKAYDKELEVKYPANQVPVLDKKGKRFLDSYDPVKGEIISRKSLVTSNGQIALADEFTMIDYFQEFALKYPRGAIIANTRRARKMLVNGKPLAGQTLTGKYVLEVPVQNYAIPDRIIYEARVRNIIIRDEKGKVY